MKEREGASRGEDDRDHDLSSISSTSRARVSRLSLRRASFVVVLENYAWFKSKGGANLHD